MDTTNLPLHISNFPWKRTWDLDEGHLHNKRQKRCMDKGRRGRDTALPRTPPWTWWPHNQELSPKYETLSWVKGLCLTSGIPALGASTGKMSPYNVRFWKSMGIQTRRIWTAENRDSTLKEFANKPKQAEIQCKSKRLKNISTVSEGDSVTNFKVVGERQEPVGILSRNRSTGRCQFYKLISTWQSLWAPFLLAPPSPLNRQAVINLDECLKPSHPAQRLNHTWNRQAPWVLPFLHSRQATPRSDEHSKPWPPNTEIKP